MNQLGSDRSGDGGLLLSKAIQSASKIRKSIPKECVIPLCPDNPLETGSTLASGGLENTVKPTYLITIKILEQIFNIK
jgi:hypothetical protein